MLDLFNGILQNKLAKASAILVVIQGLTLIVSMLGNILLAKIFPTVASYGEYTYYFTLITTFGYSAVLGLDMFLLKENTLLIKEQNWDKSAELKKKSIFLTLISSFILACLVITYKTHFFRLFTINYLLVGLGIVLSAYLVIITYILRSTGEIWKSNFWDQSGKVLIFYGFVFVLNYFFEFNEINVGIFSFLLALIVCILIIQFNVQSAENQNNKLHNSYTYQFLLKSGFYFFLFDIIGNFSLNMDVFLLEEISNNSFLGGFTFYKKLSVIPFMAISIVGTILQSKYVTMYLENNVSKTQSFILKSNRILVAISLFLVLAMFLTVNMLPIFNVDFFKYFSNYESYRYMLNILVIGELLCSVFGPNIQFMIMVDLEKQSIVIQLLHMIVYILLSLILFNFYGEVGYIYAYVSAKIVKNCLCWWIIKQKTQISFFIV